MNRKMSARVFVDVGQNGNVGVEQNGNVDVEVGVDKTGSPFSVRRLSTYMFEADPANANQEELTRSSKYQSGDMDLNMDADAESTCMQNSNGVKFPPRSPLGNNSNDEIPITHARNDVVRRHVNTHIEKHSDNYMAPRMSVIEMLFEDADFIKFKRTNITFDTCSSIPLLIFQAFVFVTRASLAETFFLSPYFSAALVMSIGTIFLFSVLMVVLFAERYTNPNYISAKMSNSKSANNSSNIRRSGSIKFDFAAQKKQVEIQAYNDFYKRIIQTPVFQETFEFLAIIGSISIGLYLYARVEIGPCPPNVSLWDSQRCNPVAESGSIPHDQVLLCYLVPILWQLLLKRTRFRTIIASWVISTIFVGVSIMTTKSYLQTYTLLYSLPFLFIHYETERFLRATYLQNVLLLEEIFKQQKKEKRHAVEKINYENALEKMIEKQQFSQEINHLRILIDNIAHNLKTPIQSINMGIELLRSEYSSSLGGLNSKSSELPFEFLVETIHASCMFMTMAINRSVDFTMVNSNVSLIPVYETRKFTEVLSEQIACIKTLQNTVHLKMGPMPPSMCSHTILDVIWVKESLLCLLSNSVRHSSGGTIHINTELVAGDDEDTVSRTSQKKDSLSDVNMYIKVTVVDDGVGISEKTRKNIFQPLRPSNSPTGGKEVGTGLGLYSLCKRMEALKGSCGTRPRLDGKDGAEVWFCIPYRPDIVAENHDRANGETLDSKTLSSSSSYDNSGDESLQISIAVPSVSRLNNWAQRRVRVKKLPMPPIGGEIILYEEGSTKCELAELSDSALNVPKVEPLRILIIEDSITIIMIVTKLLEKKGHIVESAKNGFSGLNRLKEVFNTRSDFDLVLLDVQMPVLDGFECVSRYRAFEVEQIKNLNNSSISKSKTDNVKLLLHSNYFRVNYANSITTGNCNMDNFKYLESNSESARKIPLIRLANVPDNYNADDRQEEKAEHRGSPSIPDKALDDQPIVRGGKGTDIVLRRGNMAIVGMSANNDNESRILALRRGMNFFITKPFSASDLQNILNLFDN